MDIQDTNSKVIQQKSGKTNPLIVSELQLLEQLATMFASSSLEDCAKLINEHYKNTDLNGLWVYNIRSSLE